MQRGRGRLALEGTDEPVNERPSIATDVQHRMPLSHQYPSNVAKEQVKESCFFFGNARDTGPFWLCFSVLLSCIVWPLN